MNKSFGPDFGRLGSSEPMSKILLCSIIAMSAYGADNPWTKVKDLKTGTELRIFKIGEKQPILATMDEATDDRLVIVVKKEQTAIDKDQIDRIDYRPPATGSRINKETRTTNDPPGQTAGPVPRGSSGGVGPSTSTSNSVSFGSKPNFETVYRRGR
jgi:hypothetical protein